MRNREDEPFYVGYMNPTPRSLLVALGCGLIGIAALAGLALALGSRTNDPGGAYYATKLGKQKLTGILEAKPYPMLRVRPDAEQPEARTLLLMAPGKFGVQETAAKFGNELVDVSGYFFRRGTIDVLQAGKKGYSLHAEEPPAERVFRPAPPEPLGRWRLRGEICDGKCYFGAMRPGVSIAHKACANLCIASGAAPVFVTTSPVEGSSFLLLADRDGEPLPDAFRHFVAVRVELEGEVERRDDLLIFRVDVTSAEVL